MNENVKTIEADVDGIVSVGQAADAVVKKAGQALAERKEAATAPAERREMSPLEMVGRALEMGASPEILKQMMDLRDREEARNAKLAFTKAVAAAKAELRPIMKTRTVNYKPDNKPLVNYRHEDLAGIEAQVTPILTKHGLSYRFDSDNGVDRPITVTCILEHVDGHSTRTALSGPADSGAGKNSLQAIASTTTYLQRYTLKLALGLSVSNDDDGRGADDVAGPISEEQLARMLALLSESGADTQIFCEKYKIDAVKDLPASKFEAAYGDVERWFQRQKQRVA